MTTLVFAFSIFSGRYFDAHGTRTLLICGSVVFIGALVGIACECTATIVFHGSLQFRPNTGT